MSNNTGNMSISSSNSSNSSQRPTKRVKTEGGGTAKHSSAEDADDDDAAAAATTAAASATINSGRKKSPSAAATTTTTTTTTTQRLPSSSSVATSSFVLLPGYGEHKRAVSSVKFAPGRLTKSGAVCASSSADGYIKLWNVQQAFSHEPSAAAAARKENNNTTAKDVHDTHKGEEADDVEPMETTTTTTTPNPVANGTHDDDDDGDEDVDNTGASSSSSSLRNKVALEATVTCGGHTRGINEIAWNPVLPYLASASDDKTIRLWDMITGDPLVEYRGHDNFVFCVDQHQHMIVSGSFDETVKLWDIRSGDCVSTLPAHSDPVTSVSFNRDGTVVCTSSHDGLIRLWDVASGECLKTLYAAGNPPVCHAKFSPNSKYILAGTLLDATLRLWPVQRSGSHKCAKTYKSEKHHTNAKYSIVADFTHDGNIVTGSETGKVLVYDLQSQDVSHVLEGHEDAVLAVSAHDRLPLLASGAMTADRRVHFWAPGQMTL